MGRFGARLAAAALACALAACGETAAPPPMAEQPSAESPSTTAPAPSTPAPSTEAPDAAAPAQPAPRNEDAATTAPAEPPAAAPDRRMTESAIRDLPSVAPPPMAAPPRTMERVLTPVLVELLADAARTARQGGSAVVLLGDPNVALLAQRNAALCRSLFQSFDQATTGEVQVGVRRSEDGEVELLRPIYWPTRTLSPGQPGADRCPQRLLSYDYPRAERIKRKFRLTGAGPFLVVERNDPSQTERVAAVIDLSRTRAADVPQMVRYFRDGFMQRGDIWNPRIYTPERTRGDLTAFFGQPVNYGFLPRLVRVTQQVGCPLANLLDICDAP